MFFQNFVDRVQVCMSVNNPENSHLHTRRHETLKANNRPFHSSDNSEFLAGAGTVSEDEGVEDSPQVRKGYPAMDIMME